MPVNRLPDSALWSAIGASLHRSSGIHQNDRTRHSKPLLDRICEYADDHAPVQYIQAMVAVIDLDQR
jgi:hypothetical protein